MTVVEDAAGSTVAYRAIEALADIGLLGTLDSDGDVRLRVRRFTKYFRFVNLWMSIHETDPSYFRLTCLAWSWDAHPAPGLSTVEVDAIIFGIIRDYKGVAVHRTREGDAYIGISGFIAPDGKAPDTGALASILDRSLAAIEDSYEDLIDRLVEANDNVAL